MIDSRIAITHGARATEECLVARVRELRDAARRDWTLLQRPVRIVVPSVSLRNHLSTVLAVRCGALAGFQVSTLMSLALEILRASGHRPQVRGSALFDVLVRRFARLQDSLSDRLDGLTDGYAVVSGTVRDFFDAGFETAHLAGLEELLESLPDTSASADEIDRARALLRVTAATWEAMETLEARHRSTILREAGETIEAAGPDVLPTRELLVHGFAEATGVVTDLLASLLRVCGGTLYLDRPPTAGGFESAHTERLAGRLSQVARVDAADPSQPAEEVSSPEISLVAAPDPDAEMREVLRRIRRLLEAGESPESIGLVARSLDGRGALVRRHFRALGVPFSGGRASAPLGRPGRDLAVLRDLLRLGCAAPLERWLDALGDLPEAASDLRRSFFALGASRLEDLSRLAEGALEEIAARGVSLAQDLDEWASGERTFRDHVARLAHLLDHRLDWTEDKVPTRRVIDEAVETLDVPADLALPYDEFVQVTSAAFEGRAREPLGGRGGGVRVLDAMEARGLTFGHLFLFSAVRDVLPRPVREDPLLPDRLRRSLTRLLPDLPVKASGFDEERYLFAQLLSSAPRVTVSWHEADANGDAAAPSPFVEGLRLSRERAPRVLDPASSAWRPVEEELLVSAIHGDRKRFADVLPLALEEIVDDSTALARARLAVVEELDPDRRRREGRIRSRRLGPYFGFLGPVSGDADPRRGDPFVTTLENLAVCPWQTFLRRVLRVAPMPDPLASLPSLRGLLVGRLVHQVLERIGRQRSAAWPEEESLEALLAEEAGKVLAAEGLGLKGLGRAAAELARPYLAAAARVDWAAGREPGVLGVETTESLRLSDRAGRERRIRFRVDRIDQEGAGRTYTDYKTGALPRKRRDLHTRVDSGQWLQAAAYVHEDRPPRSGRYVFLRPDLDDSERVLQVCSGDPELAKAFEATVIRLLDVWDRGFFFPRLVAPDEDLEPPRCASCRVAEACLRRDSGARGRLRRWAEAASERAERGERAEASDALLAVWWLSPS